MRQLICFLVVLLPSAAFAQDQAPAAPSSAIADVRRDARMHLGPLYLTPTVGLKEIGVDTNVFNSAADQKADFTFTLTPKADLWVPFARRALVKGTVASDLVWYSKYGSERSVDPQFTVRGEGYLHRLTLFAENGYLNTRQRPNFEVDLRSRHLENDFTAGIDLRVTPKLSLEAAALRDVVRYDADAFFEGASLQRTLNRDTTGLRVVGRDKFTPLTTIALKFEALEDRFPFMPSRNADSVRVMPGVEFKPRALISGSAYVGYRRFTPVTAGVLPEFKGLVSQLGLSYTLLGSTVIGVAYRRDLTYSIEELQPFFVNNNAGLSVRHGLGPRFDVQFSADRFRYNYQNLDVAGAAAALGERVDTTWNYVGSVGYRIGRQGRAGFGVSYFDRTSTSKSIHPYSGLRFGSVVSVGL